MFQTGRMRLRAEITGAYFTREKGGIADFCELGQ